MPQGYATWNVTESLQFSGQNETPEVTSMQNSIVRARALSISQKWLCVNQGGQALTAKTYAGSYNGILYTDGILYTVYS